MRKGMNLGINKGLDYMYRDKNVDDNSPEAKQTSAEAKKASKNVRQTMRTIRRIGRF
jgi:hypothetical protein